MAVRLKRLTGSEAHNSHRHVILASGSTAEQLFPLRLASYGNLIMGPTCPFELIKVFGGSTHGKETFFKKKSAFYERPQAGPTRSITADCFLWPSPEI